ESAVHGVSVEGIADSKGRRGTLRDPLYPYLWRLSKVAGRRLFRGDLQRDGTEPSSCRPPRHYRHPRRWHDDSGEERRRQRRVQRTQEVKGDKVVAFCDRNCNIIAPFVAA